LNYYRRFPGDYLKDTRKLTLMHHGAYTLLLDELYATQQRIPSTEDAHRICQANTPEERSAVEFILQNFFKKTSTGFTNKRYEKEAKKRAQWRKWQKNHRHTNPDIMPDKAPDNGLKISTYHSQYSNTNTKEKPKRVPSPGFDTFWEAYPRHVGKMEARKAWVKKLAEEHLGEILAGLASWKKTNQWQDREYIPYPATFLNAERWKENPLATNSNGKSLEQQRKEIEQRAGIN